MTKEAIQNLLASLSLDDKIKMVHGAALFKTGAVPEKDIPAFVFSDGPMGTRPEYQEDDWLPICGNDDYTSYLPCNSALAATFNRRRAYEAGQVVGAEARGRGKDMILAPGINIHRSPLGGRNFEYMSEDPFLTAEIAVPYIKGVQESDVSACAKHYTLNNQETKRYSVNVSVSERALWEIYLPAFRAAVYEADVYGVMAAYNQYKNEFLCHSRELINEILRGEWGFDGIVVSDWNAVHDTVKGGLCEIDADMSTTNDFDNYCFGNPLKEAILSGHVPESELDKKVLHLLTIMDRLHMLSDTRTERKSGHYNMPADREKLLIAAEESIILLKNDDGILPLHPKKLRRIVMIGDNADRIHAEGGGSAEIKALYEISPLLGMKMLLGGNCEVIYEPGYYNFVIGNAWDEDTAQNTLALTMPTIPELMPRQARRVPEDQIETLNREYLKRALEAAENADAVIFVGGLSHDHDVEARDRSDYALPLQQQIVLKELLKLRPDTVVTILGGSPVDTSGWGDLAKALLYVYYGGMETGLALAHILLGNVSPSGKLPTTFPKKLSDSPAHSIGEFPGGDTVHYTEDIFVGYRHFATRKIEPAFAFGHGLSYADFAYRDLMVEKSDSSTWRNFPIADTAATDVSSAGASMVDITPSSDTEHNHTDADMLSVRDLPTFCTVRFVVENTSAFTAMESAQVYVAPADTKLTDKAGKPIERPALELRGFDKKEIKGGESASYEIALTPLSFAYYDENAHCYIAPAGDYEICVGGASDDISLRQQITIEQDIKIRRY